MSLMESIVLNMYLYVGHSLSKRKNCRVSFYQFISTPLKMVRGWKTSLAFVALCQDEFFPFSTNILFFFFKEYIQNMISKAPIFTVDDANPFLISDD